MNSSVTLLLLLLLLPSFECAFVLNGLTKKKKHGEDYAIIRADNEMRDYADGEKIISVTAVQTATSTD